MSTESETSDRQLLDLLRREGGLGISQLGARMDVTPTAVRQRLTRLMQQGLVQRSVDRGGRGRPGHRYELTEKARRQAGSNFADLALVLWQEVRAVKDPEIRRGLLERLAKAMAKLYGEKLQGAELPQRMASLAALFAERDVALSIDASGGLPVLRANDCPYPDLVEKDRGICAFEKMLFSELLGAPVRLSECRVEGGHSCVFEASC